MLATTYSCQLLRLPVLLFDTTLLCCLLFFFFFSSRRRHTRCSRDWSSDVCSSDLNQRREDEVMGDEAQPFEELPRHVRVRALRGIGAQAQAAEIGRASCRERV